MHLPLLNPQQRFKALFVVLLKICFEIYFQLFSWLVSLHFFSNLWWYSVVRKISHSLDTVPRPTHRRMSYESITGLTCYSASLPGLSSGRTGYDCTVCVYACNTMPCMHACLLNQIKSGRFCPLQVLEQTLPLGTWGHSASEAGSASGICKGPD